MDIKEQMKEHIARHKESGLSFKAYCEQHNLKEHIFFYWRNKLNGKQIIKPIASSFTSINLSSASGAGALSVQMPSGIVLDFSSLPDVKFLKQLIQ